MRFTIRNFWEEFMLLFRWILVLLSMLLVMPPVAVADQSSTSVDEVLQKLKITKDSYICSMAGHTQEFSKPDNCPICGMPLQKKYPRLHVAVLLFKGVEEIDYAGPIEVFGSSGAEVFTVAVNSDPVRSAYDLQIKPDYDIEHAPVADVVLVPGGDVDNAYNDARLMAWLRQRSASSHIVMSVCNGAFVLGKAGLLDGLSATTTAGAVKSLASTFPSVHAVGDRRYVDNGKIITAAGLTSGIDGALHVIDREHGRLSAEEVARYMEYDWHPEGESPYGVRAQFKEPGLAEILPADASWQYLSNHGDTEQWEISGHMETAMDGDVFLTATDAQLAKSGWKLQAHAKLLRTYQKSDADGNWQLSMELVNEAALPVYHMRMTVRKVITAKKTAALH